jgi:mycothione reductase
VRVRTQGAAGSYVVEAERILFATGRMPNGDTLNPAAGGVELDQRGYLRVDAHQRTTAQGVWALGDICSPWMLKHVANHEARVVQHNLLHPDDLVAADHRYVPRAAFTNPQVAWVGLTEQQCQQRGLRYAVGVRDYGGVAYGWALEEGGDHFAKVIADPATGQLLGAHIIGPQAAVLLQPLVQAMSFGVGAREMARSQYWIHPALTELVENALLELTLD